MVYKYLFGNPISTEAVEKSFPVCESELSLMVKEKGEKLQFIYTMGEKDIVYGLGENVRGINKRGGIYESKCSDETQHVEDKHSNIGGSRE